MISLIKVFSTLESIYPSTISTVKVSFKEISLIPQDIDGKGTIGAQLQPNISKETNKTKNFYELFKYTNNEFSLIARHESWFC